jgi:ribosomal protein L12E/L44/L45/RPP1/RPP2
MSWSVLLPLLAKFGIDATYRIYQITQEHPEPNDAAWAKLLALSGKTVDQYVAEAQARLPAAAAPPTPPAPPEPAPAPAPPAQ